MRVLITGISGFVGSHLLDYLVGDFKSQGSSATAGSACGNLELTGLDISVKGLHFDAKKNNRTVIDLIECDLRDSSKIEKIIDSFKPDHIYHLAAQSSVGLSWGKPIETFEINVFGSINIFEAVLKKCPECKILVTCTAEEYGPIREMGHELPIDEHHSIYPSNPYSISKATLDFFSSTYYSAKNLQTYIARSFNHTGPGQSASFVASDFAKQIAEIEKGDREPVIYVGNTGVYRDFLDVRDVVRAYKSIIDRGHPGEAYNVCSGNRIKISELLDILLALSNKKEIKVVVDKNKLRPVDLKIVYGTNKKIKNITGWEPAIDIRTSLADILNWWRKEKGAD